MRKIPIQRPGEICSFSQNFASSATMTFPMDVAGSTKVRSAHDSEARYDAKKQISSAIPSRICGIAIAYTRLDR